MSDISVTLIASDVPVNALVDDPVITIRRLDTGAAVVTTDAMTDTGADGNYRYSFTPTAGLCYSFLIDADPSVTGQVDVRFFDGSLNHDIRDIWNDLGLNPAAPKTNTENTEGSDYDEDVAAPVSIHKDIVKVGAVTTVTRT